MWNKVTKKGVTYWNNNRNYKYHLFNGEESIELMNLDKDKYDIQFGSNGRVLEEHIPSLYETLPVGIYRIIIRHGDWELLEHKMIDREDLLDLGPLIDIKQDFLNFIESKDVYAKLKMVHKRGVLLFGPPGTGKTSAIHKIVDDLEIPIMIFFINGVLTDDLCKMFQDDERMKIFIMEELTEFTEGRNYEWLLNFLDGEMSPPNSFIIGTTNYPEKLPSNVINRPGRFDKFYYMGHLSTHNIAEYWSKTTGEELSKTDLSRFKNTTLAELKEIVLLVLRDKLTLQQAIDKIIDQQTLVAREFKKQRKKDEDYLL